MTLSPCTDRFLALFTKGEIVTSLRPEKSTLVHSSHSVHSVLAESDVLAVKYRYSTEPLISEETLS